MKSLRTFFDTVMRRQICDSNGAILNITWSQVRQIVGEQGIDQLIHIWQYLGYASQNSAKALALLKKMQRRLARSVIARGETQLRLIRGMRR
jgi:hypothetical protein